MIQSERSLAEELAEVLDDAVARPTPQEVTARVKDALVELIARGALEVPDRFRRPKPDAYARRLLLREPGGAYSAIVMTWGPGQGTMLHDHAGIWCVEGVLEGEIEVTQYDLLEERDERYRFARQGTVRAGRGSAGTLIPPFEYHTIHNAVADRPTLTLHVYGGDMDHCGVFAPQADGWYRRESRELRFDE
jgi:predicted metal-dependent enzyme (double-stranded beta helix superfamily)